LNAQRHPAIFAARSLNPNGEDTPNVGNTRAAPVCRIRKFLFFVCSSAAAVVVPRPAPSFVFRGRYLHLYVYIHAKRARARRVMAQVLSTRNTFFKTRRTLGSRCSFVELGKKCCDPETKDRIIPLWWFCTYIYCIYIQYTGRIINIYLCGGAKGTQNVFPYRPCAVLMGWEFEG